MPELTIKQLLEAGVHFGHQRQRWNPKMKPFIFTERNGIHIINLEISVKYMQQAGEFLKEIAQQGQSILFVGTKKQAAGALRAAAEKCKMPYVEQRWLGGMLTNFETVQKSVRKLDSIDEMEREGNFQFVTKKEANSLKKDREKLVKNLSGVRNMKKLPGALFVIDSENEKIAILEARKLGLPIVAVVDSNADPDLVDRLIPGNDDAIKAIKLYCEYMADVINEGRLEHEQKIEAEKQKQAEEAADAEAASQQEDAGGNTPESTGDVPPTKTKKAKKSAPQAAKT